jgi:ATP-dependent exoDNAse (exonuclease V) beta subunit
VQDLVNLLRLAFLKDDDENIYALLQSNLCGFSSKEEMLFCLAKKDISQTLGQSFTIADAILCFANDCSDEAKVSKSLMLKAMQLLLDGDDFFKDIALSGMGASLQKLCSICALIAKNTELDFLSLLDTLMLSFEEFYAPNELKLLSYLEAKAAEYHNAEPSAEPLGFILFYDKIKNQSIKNPSLALGEGVVRLSTIHSAKGLESKVVILLDADAKKGTNSKKELIFDEENGVFFMEPSATCKFKDTSVAWQIIKKYNLATKTEELNLLYVALTRAKQALFIFTSEKLKEEDTK